MREDADIIASLERQVDSYRRLAKLAELQHVHVQQHQTDSLLDVLEHRSAVLEEITQLEREIAPAKRNWADYLGGLAPDQRARAEGLMHEARALLEQITTADQTDALVLQQRKLNLGREIQRAKAA